MSAAAQEPGAEEWVGEPWVPRLAPARVWGPTAAASAALGAAGWLVDSQYGPLPGALLALVCAVLPWLCAIDWLTFRLPDAIVLPLLGASLAAAAGAAAGGLIGWDRFLVAVYCAAGASGVFFIVAWATGGLGWGDVKLAAVLGFVLGLLGVWHAVLGAGILPFILGGFIGIPLLFSGHGKAEIAFGPFMAAAALLAALCPPLVAVLAPGLGN